MTAEQSLSEIQEIIDDRYNWETAIQEIMRVLDDYSNSL